MQIINCLFDLEYRLVTALMSGLIFSVMLSPVAKQISATVTVKLQLAVCFGDRSRFFPGDYLCGFFAGNILLILCLCN